MIAFDDLPNEIVLHIINNNLHVESITNLFLVNTRYYDLCGQKYGDYKIVNELASIMYNRGNKRCAVLFKHVNIQNNSFYSLKEFNIHNCSMKKADILKLVYTIIKLQLVVVLSKCADIDFSQIDNLLESMH